MTRLATRTMPGGDARVNERLVERINRLYHEWTATRFDDDHRIRHRIEARFWRRVGRCCLSSSGMRTGRVVLDVGCGSGFVLQQIARFLTPGDLAIGVDLSAASLQLARRREKDGESPRQSFWAAGSGTRLPFASESVTLVTMNAALHHFAAPAHVLDEIDRVLQPNGHLAIGFEPNAPYFQTESLRAVGRALDRLCWYASPRQNWRRLRGGAGGAADTCGTDEQIARRIARQLVMEGTSLEELPVCAILDLVDAHARGGSAGLDFDALLSTALSGYTVLHRSTSDYFGASARACRLLRSTADGLGRLLEPDLGCLVSCVLRKPGVQR